jgi:hypothetical protein
MEQRTTGDARVLDTKADRDSDSEEVSSHLQRKGELL